MSDPIEQPPPRHNGRGHSPNGEMPPPRNAALGNGTEEKPPTRARSESRSGRGGFRESQKVSPTLLGAAIAFFLLLVTAGVVVPLLLQSQLPGSVENDEPVGWRQTGLYQNELTRLRADWLQHMQEGGGRMIAAPAGQKSISWWDKRRKLPNEVAVKAALQRRLGKDWELLQVEPISYVAHDQFVEVDYQVTVRPLADIERARVVAMKDRMSGESEAMLQRAQWLIGAPWLPAGLAIQPAGGLPVVPAGQKITLPWKVEDARVEDGVWRIFKAGPLAIEEPVRRPDDWVQASMRRTDILLTAEQLRQSSRVLEQSVANLRAELERIEEQVRQAEAEVQASIPPRPSRSKEQFGGAGSGEPTKTGMRVVGGAATGASIGAIAGGGEGAGWGALGGAILGGVYDVASKAGDKKRFEQQKEAEYQRQLRSYESARRQAEARIKNLRPALLKELDTRLAREAAEHNRMLEG